VPARSSTTRAYERSAGPPVDNTDDELGHLGDSRPLRSPVAEEQDSMAANQTFQRLVIGEYFVDGPQSIGSKTEKRSPTPAHTPLGKSAEARSRGKDGRGRETDTERGSPLPIRILRTLYLYPSLCELTMDDGVRVPGTNRSIPIGEGFSFTFPAASFSISVCRQKKKN
jgi:hypothetical protein